MVSRFIYGWVRLTEPSQSVLHFYCFDSNPLAKMTVDEFVWQHTCETLPIIIQSMLQEKDAIGVAELEILSTGSFL